LFFKKKSFYREFPRKEFLFEKQKENYFEKKSCYREFPIKGFLFEKQKELIFFLFLRVRISFFGRLIAVVLAVSQPTALFAEVSLAVDTPVVFSDARPAALLAPAFHAVVLADA
jgi:hypothetical protein